VKQIWLSLENFVNSTSNTQVFLVLVLVGFLTYFNSLFNGFVQDDYSMILENPVVHSLRSLPYAFKGSSFSFGTTISDIYYRPLSTVSFTLIYALFGPRPFYFHFLQIGIHITNTFLIYLIFRGFFKNTLAAALSLIFLVHPLNAESVLYISALQGVIFTLLGLGAFLLLRSQNTGSLKFYQAALLLFAAFLSKESALVLVPIFLFYASLYLKKHLPLFMALCAAAALAYGFLRFVTLGFFQVLDTVSPMMQLGLGQRLLNIPGIIYFYLSTFFLPTHLSTGQVWVVASPNFNNFYLPLAATALFLGLLFGLGRFVFSRRRAAFPPFIFFCVWFVFGLLPYLQIVPLNQTVAERYFYLASIGLLGVIGTAIQLLKVTTPGLKALVTVLTLLFISGLLVRTVVRNSDWKNGQALARHDLAYSGPSYVLENALGYELSKAGDLLGAEKHYLESVKLVPNWWISLNNLGSVQFKYTRAGHPDYLPRARDSFQQSATHSGNFSTPYENLATLYFSAGDHLKTQQFVSTAVNKFPQNAKLWFFLGLTEHELGNTDSAREAMRKAALLDAGNSQYRQLYQQLLQNTPFQIQNL